MIRRAHRAPPALLCACALWCWAVAPGARAQPREPRPEVRAEIGRLEGQRVRVLDQDAPHGRGYVIDDVAGEGAPVVGVVERRGQALWLVAEDGASYRLAGPLARPRIAGPGYEIWALGAVTAGSGERVLVARRVGVLAPPWQRALRPAGPAGRSSRSRPGRPPGPAAPSSPSRD